MTPSELIQKIESVDPGNDNDFREIISGVLSMGFVNERDLAHEFSVSRPMVERWKNGQNAPHPKIRVPIYKYLFKVLERRRW